MGAIAPGVHFFATGSSPDRNLAVLTPTQGQVPSTAIDANDSADTLVVDFTSPVDTVGFDLASCPSERTCTLTIGYVDLSPATTRSVTCPQSPDQRFFGFTADRLIDYVTLNGGVFLDNLRFGTRTPTPAPTPSNALAVGAVRTAARAGTATVSVSVPGIGTTTVGGKDVAAASVDSARARTVSLPVAVTGALRKALKRTGKATAQVTVTYAPVGGTPASRDVTVKLRLKHQGR
ncbi:hypothetical protein G5V58_08430 [Nocardioides anomalus]|uniref:Uncharacterized protein n=1 Tax=Nocardioides anomalus TaxID=2712223 RepID=A0A6G6WCB7_9ACTN|nr:hypothetical protein [Nocardioides anomalus]QIG42797.1 hypothetical protein G5V58_08430 [Nocardioides anomalus]